MVPAGFEPAMPAFASPDLQSGAFNRSATSPFYSIAPDGLEPSFAVPKTAVLPLDDRASITTSGDGEIRTHGAPVRGTLVFKTRAINHSATTPFIYKHVTGFEPATSTLEEWRSAI